MRRFTVSAIVAGMLVSGLLIFELATTRGAHAQASCGNANFQGGYGYTFNGTSDGGLFVSAGRLVADGHGNLSGAETASFDGDVFHRRYTGTYTVNQDCTGSATTIDGEGTTTACDFVIVAGGQELRVVEADPGTAIIGTLKRQ